MEDGFELGRAEERRRTAAEEYAMHRHPLRGSPTNQPHFADQGFHIGRDEVLMAGVGIEVAVGAAVAAKGNMEVQGIGHEKM